MLKTVLRHKARALSRTAVLFLILFLAVAILGGGMGLIIGALSTAEYFPLISGILMLLLIVLALSPLLLFAVYFILLVYRFYASLFTDEGYLSFMLPVRRSTLLFGKVLAGLLHLLAVMLATAASYAVMALLPRIAYDAGMGSLLYTFFETLLLSVGAGSLGWLTATLFFLSVIIQVLSALVLGYLAVVLGAVFFRRHKLLGAVLFSVALYMLVQGLSNFLSILILLLFFRDLEAMTSAASLLASGILTVVLFGGLAVLGYFLAYRLITRRLNLE